MSNPPRQKGTSYETELVNQWNACFGDSNPMVRNPASATFDLTKPGYGREPLEILATRPDRGQSLVTMRWTDFMSLFGSFTFERSTPVHVEAKRYKRFSLHSIFEETFG